MQVLKINVDNDMREITKHGSYDLPIAVYTDNFRLFEDGHIRWHWHKEVQFSYCISDKICFFIEDEKIVLEPGEGIFVNSNILHKIKPYNENCMMFSIVFDKILISGTPKSVIERKYVDPLMQSNNFKFILLKEQIKWQQGLLSYLKEIFDLSNSKPYGYELEMRNYLNLAWLNLIREIKDNIKYNESISSYDEKRVRVAMEYIHNHYMENISLDNIADKICVSKSECCRCFKRILRMTPFEYLMEYRILKASEELAKNNETISNIAINNGFNGTSYFGKIFKKYTGSTPSEYRKTLINKGGIKFAKFSNNRKSVS